MTSHGVMNELLERLHASDGARREKARKSLITIGEPAVEPLLELLSDPKDLVRWEACKTLGSIGSPQATTQLVEALRDDNVEVRWLAAEGLIRCGRASIVPLLKALETHFNSMALREGAHHVLYAFERQGLLTNSILALLDTLRSLEPVSTVALAAHRALRSVRSTSAEQSHTIVAVTRSHG
jgi:HEAT repeat protein